MDLGCRPVLGWLRYGQTTLSSITAEDKARRPSTAYVPADEGVERAWSRGAKENAPKRGQRLSRVRLLGLFLFLPKEGRSREHNRIEEQNGNR